MQTFGYVMLAISTATFVAMILSNVWADQIGREESK